VTGFFPEHSNLRNVDGLMKKALPISVVYNPPVLGLPYLAVIIMPNGSVSARPFDSHEEAAAHGHHLLRDKSH
jgi:hypothetical protein